MRLLFAMPLVLVNALCSCASAGTASPSPLEIVRKLMPVSGRYQTYTKTAEIKTLKFDLTPQLYSTLMEWAELLEKAKAATDPQNHDMQMMLPGSDNVFFGQSVFDDEPKLNESIKGDEATVALTSILQDTDGETILRETAITLFFSKRHNRWVVRDVQRDENSFGSDRMLFTYELLRGLRKDIVDFRKLAR